MEILSSELWGPATFLLLGQRTKNSSVKGRNPQLMRRAGLCQHLALSVILLLYLHTLLPLLWGPFLTVVSLLQGCRLAASLFCFCLCKTCRLSQLPETKNTAGIKQQPLKGCKNLHLGVSTENAVFRLKLRAEHSPRAWHGSTAVWDLKVPWL